MRRRREPPGASVWRVSLDVTLPMVLPAMIFSAALNLLLGFEMFGIPLVLGDPNGILVLTTYTYKLTTLFGVPTYQLMAVVAVVLILITLPLVFFQRRLLRHSRRFAALGGKGDAIKQSEARHERSGHRTAASSAYGCSSPSSCRSPASSCAPSSTPGARASIFSTS